jgi:hypothetical protein
VTVRHALAAVVLALLAPAGAAAAVVPGSTTPTSSSPSIALSNARAGAHPDAVTIAVQYAMQCGYPGPGPITVTFPVAMHLPKTISPGAVLVSGAAATSVKVSGRQVIVGLAPPPHLMCDVMAVGTLKLQFTPAAQLGNPTVPGTYTVAIAKGTAVWHAAVHISPR